MSDAGGSTVATTNTEGKAYSPYAILLHGGLDFVTLQESELTPNRQSRLTRDEAYVDMYNIVCDVTR